MTKEMIISSSSHETRVAILEDDQVAEIFIERERQRGVVGNVYKGRVSKVLPGMQSAFVDIGLERDAFLYVSDVLEPDDEDEADDEEENGGGRSGESQGGGRDRRGRDRGPLPKIDDLLRQGQEVLVQVVKEPLGTKGARITSHATLPGRFLVFMPTVDHIGVSRPGVKEGVDKEGDLRAIKLLVGPHIHHVFPPGPLDPVLQGRGVSPVFFVQDQLEGRMPFNQLPDHVTGAVTAAVFNNDHFTLPMGIGLHDRVKILKNVRNIPFFVVDRNDKTDERFLCHKRRGAGRDFTRSSLCPPARKECGRW